MWQLLLQLVPGLLSSLEEVFKRAVKFAIDGLADYIDTEDRVKNKFREIGYTGKQLHAITKNLIDDTKRWGAQYGLTQDQIERIEHSLQKTHKTVAQMSTDTKEAFIGLSKVLGEDKVGAFVGKMQDFGMHAKSAQAWLGRGVIQAKALGINASEFTQQMTEAVKLQDKMHFSNGIAGLQKMVGLAMRLGTDVKTLTGHIDLSAGKFKDIEGSIENSANLQRLGGSWAANFGNPLEVMAEGMFDAESAAERLAKTLEGKAVFNRQTGQAEMGWYNSRQLVEASNALGVSHEELMKISRRQAMNKELEAEMTKSGAITRFTPENMDALKNIAQFNADLNRFEVSFTTRSGDNITADVNELTPQDLKEILTLTDEEKSVDKNVNIIAGKVGVIADIMQGNARDTASAKEVREGAKASLSAWRQSWAPDSFVEGARTGVQGLGRASEGATNAENGVWTWIKGLFGARKNGGIVESTPTGFDQVQSFANGGIVGDKKNNTKVVPSNSFSSIQRFESGGIVNNATTNSSIIDDSATSFSTIQAFANGGVAKPEKSLKGVPTLYNGNFARPFLPSDVKVGDFYHMPTFATGGAIDDSMVVPGNYTQGDTVVTRVNSGELILNKKQQENLYQIANTSPVVKPEHKDSSFKNTRPQYGLPSQVSISNKYRYISLNTEYGSSGNTMNGAAMGGLLSASRIAGRVHEGTVRYVTSPQFERTMSTVLNRGTDLVNRTNTLVTNSTQRFRELGTSVQNWSMRHSPNWVRNARLNWTLNSSIDGTLASKVTNVINRSTEIATKATNLGNSAISNATRISVRVGDATLKASGSAIKGISRGISNSSDAIVRGTTRVIGQRAGNMVRTLGPIGTVISAGIATYSAANAFSEFNDLKKDIEARSDLDPKAKQSLIREASDAKNEKVGAAAGSTIGAIAGGAIGSLFGPGIGTTIGAVAGGFIGEKIGGAVGKQWNNFKDFLVGKEATLTAEQQSQLEYEEYKLGEVGLDDPQLMEKAAYATVSMHDLLISIWHHMNGRASNGEEVKQGFFSKLGNVLGGAVGLVTSPLATMPARRSTGVNNANVNIQATSTNEVSDLMQDAALATIDSNMILGSISDILYGGINNGTLNYFNDTDYSTYNDSLLNNLYGENDNINALKASSINTFEENEGSRSVDVLKVSENDLRNNYPLSSGLERKVSVVPEPLGEKEVTIKPSREYLNGQYNVGPDSINHGVETIKLEVSGTLRLDGGNGNVSDVDMRKVLNNPAMQNYLLDVIYRGLNQRGNNGRYNKNSMDYITNGMSNRYPSWSRLK